MTDAQDRELVRRCTQHDRDAWERFVAVHGDYIFSLVNYSLNVGRYGSCREDAEDIFADVLLSLVEKDFHTFRSFKWRCSLKTLLWSITRKRVARHFRKRGARVRAVSLSRTDEEGQPDVSVPPAPDSSPVDSAQTKEAHETLRQVMAALGERDRLCLSLYFFDGLSYREIAKVVGVPANQVGIMIFRAKKKLEERLDGRSM